MTGDPEATVPSQMPLTLWQPVSLVDFTLVVVWGTYVCDIISSVLVDAASI